MISQLINHKAGSKTIPKPQAGKCLLVWNTLNAVEADQGDSQDSQQDDSKSLTFTGFSFDYAIMLLLLLLLYSIIRLLLLLPLNMKTIFNK